jgi:hypothetical protein
MDDDEHGNGNGKGSATIKPSPSSGGNTKSAGDTVSVGKRKLTAVEELMVSHKNPKPSTQG